VGWLRQAQELLWQEEPEGSTAWLTGAWWQELAEYCGISLQDETDVSKKHLLAMPLVAYKPGGSLAAVNAHMRTLHCHMHCRVAYQERHESADSRVCRWILLVQP
jgi:hypothetical protein